MRRLCDAMKAWKRLWRASCVHCVSLSRFVEGCGGLWRGVESSGELWRVLEGWQAWKGFRVCRVEVNVKGCTICGEIGKGCGWF